MTKIIRIQFPLPRSKITPKLPRDLQVDTVGLEWPVGPFVNEPYRPVLAADPDDPAGVTAEARRQGRSVSTSAGGHDRVDLSPMPPPTISVAARALRNWLASSDTSTRALARTLGVAQPTIMGWLTGQYLPSLAHASALQKATAGNVLAVDWAQKPRAQRRSS